MISEIFCDGLGACIGECPQDALHVVKKDVADYDESKVIDNMIIKSDKWVVAHLVHLHEQQAQEYIKIAANRLFQIGRKDILDEFVRTLDIKSQKKEHKKIKEHPAACGCQGSQMIELKTIKRDPVHNSEPSDSMLEQWPVQLHLVNPAAPYFKGKELLIMSTCAPLAHPNIHSEYLEGRSVVLACPKLDMTDPYTDKLNAIITQGKIAKVKIVRMEVPCCGGLNQFALAAAKSIDHRLEISEDIIALNGTLKSSNIIFSNYLQEA